MPHPDVNPPDDPPSKPATPTLLTAAAASLACLTLYLYTINQFHDDDYKPDDTAALLAAFGNQDEFDQHFGQNPEPVSIPAEKVKRWITQPDPAGLRQTLQNLRFTDVHPPAYFLLLRYWANLAGTDYPSAAALNAIIMALNVALLTFATLRFAGPAALIPTLLFATSTGAFSAAMEIRPNALATLGLTVAVIAAMPILKNSQNTKLFLLIAIAAGSILAEYAHYLSGPVIAILFILLAIAATADRNRTALLRIAMTTSIAALALVPQWPTLAHQMNRLADAQPTTEPDQPDPSPTMRWLDSATCLALNVSAFPKTTPQNKSLFAGAILLAIPMLALAMAKRLRDVAAIAAVTLIAIALIPWLVYTGKLSPHVLQPKYYTGFALLLCILLSTPWINPPARWITLAWVAALVPLIALNLAGNKRPIKWTFTTALNQKDNRDLTAADVVLIQTLPRQRRLLVLPIAAKVKDAATLVVGTNAQLADLIRTNDLPDSPNGTYFYCAPYGRSRSFHVPKTP